MHWWRRVAALILSVILLVVILTSNVTSPLSMRLVYATGSSSTGFKTSIYGGGGARNTRKRRIKRGGRYIGGG